MKLPVLLACLVLASSTLALGEDRLRCSLVIGEEGGGHKVDFDQYAELLLSPEPAPALIHVGSASKELTFESCAKTAADGSNFSGWFEYECRDLKSLDGSSFSVDYFLIGAYAGISPPVTPAYGMYATLESIGAKVGLGTPSRTLVIYADKKPQYEFFCYDAK